MYQKPGRNESADQALARIHVHQRYLCAGSPEQRRDRKRQFLAMDRSTPEFERYMMGLVKSLAAERHPGWKDVRNSGVWHAYYAFCDEEKQCVIAFIESTDSLDEDVCYCRNNRLHLDLFKAPLE